MAEESDDVQGGLLSVTGGALRVSRPAVAVARVPTNTEEIRSRFELMGTAYEMLQLAVPNDPMINSVTREPFSDYVSYLLGRDVYG